MAEFEDAAEDLDKLNLGHENKNNSNETCDNRSPVTDNVTGGAGSSDEEYHTDEGEEPQSDSEEPKAKTKAEIKAEELRLREEKEIKLTEDERVVRYLCINLSIYYKHISASGIKMRK